MKIYDISLIIQEGMEVYKGRREKQPKLIQEKEIAKEGINESHIIMNLHTGTHLDAPLHMRKDGKDIADILPEELIKQAIVLDLTKIQGGISKEDFRSFSFLPDTFVLLKTQNSFYKRDSNDFVYLAESGARYLAEKKVAGVGIDALGIEREQEGHPTHKILMKSGILILEGLDLKDVLPGVYLLIALPIKIRGADGAPVRAVLVEPEDELFGRNSC